MAEAMKKCIISVLFFALTGYPVIAQEKPSQEKVYPKEIFDVLNNPGIGFTTFQRFNGDTLFSGISWREGWPIEYQEFDGDLTNRDHPQTSIAYFRVSWKFFEPEPKQYNWPMIDKALRTAAERGQTLMFRLSPYQGAIDVPDWYREMVGPEKETIGGRHWRIDPEDPRYVAYFGGCIKAFGQRYDGHPDLEAVDVSIIGPCGEGAFSHLLTDETRTGLVNAYLDHFKKTPLHFQLEDYGLAKKLNTIHWPDERDNDVSRTINHYGYRIDCLGDVTTPTRTDRFWSHMKDAYPSEIILSGMADAWKKAPVTMEICWTFMHWLQVFKYDEEVVEWIFNEALKWHLSSFNAKSSPVPDEWSPLVDKWLNRMGYRFVVRRFEYPSFVYRQATLPIQTMWENIGVAPVYKAYLFAVRLRNDQQTVILPTNATLTEWMPGDILHNEHLYVPHDIALGKYRLELAVVSPVSFEPRVKLAIEGKTADGWYDMGEIEIRENMMKDK